MLVGAIPAWEREASGVASYSEARVLVGTTSACFSLTGKVSSGEEEVIGCGADWSEEVTRLDGWMTGCGSDLTSDWLGGVSGSNCMGGEPGGASMEDALVD